MVQFEPFQVEHWMDDHETTCKYNIAETCCASISLSDLKSLSEQSSATEAALSETNTTRKLTYGEIRGLPALRQNLATLYSARSAGLSQDGILITPGAIAANFLTLYTLVHTGDHVIVHHPTYSQLYAIPRSLGADVTLWKAGPQKKWQLDIEELKSAYREGKTKLLILNNPNNPSGQVIPKPLLEQIIEFAAEKKLTVLCDEVYRPIFHGISPADDEFPPSAVNMGYDRVIVTGSFSKAYSLAGIRVGWIACKSPELIEQIAAARHYTTISVSLLDQVVAAEAVSDRCVHALLGRNIQLAKTNLELLAGWVEEHQWACSWVKPVAGTTAMIRFHKMGRPVDDVAFCERIKEKAGVLFVPANKCFADDNEFKGYVRVGYACETEVLKEGLEKLRGWMEEDFADVPTAAK